MVVSLDYQYGKQGEFTIEEFHEAKKPQLITEYYTTKAQERCCIPSFECDGSPNATKMTGITYENC